MKLAIIVGTRPEIIRLSRIIDFADKYFDMTLIHTGQNWSANLKDIFFEQMRIRQPDIYLNVVGNNLGETMGNIIAKSYDILKKLNPDCLLILGDTNSALCAISAKRLKIPIFHMEAGNRCYDQNVPEEINRKIVDHISDINLCYGENSRRYLLAEGFRRDHVFVTGSPMKEVLDYYKKDINDSNILNKLNLKKHNYFLLSIHREENIDIDKNLIKVLKCLEHLCDHYKKTILFSVHPRTKNKIKQKNIKFNKLIRCVEAMGFFDYVKLQQSSYCVISDSGTISEESSILNFPAVSFRTSTERPEALDAGSIVLGNLDNNRLLESVRLAIDTLKYNKISEYYDVDNVSSKTLKIIQSYVPIINKFIWMK